MIKTDASSPIWQDPKAHPGPSSVGWWPAGQLRERESLGTEAEKDGATAERQAHTRHAPRSAHNLIPMHDGTKTNHVLRFKIMCKETATGRPQQIRVYIIYGIEKSQLIRKCHHSPETALIL